MLELFGIVYPDEIAAHAVGFPPTVECGPLYPERRGRLGFCPNCGFASGEVGYLAVQGRPAPHVAKLELVPCPVCSSPGARLAYLFERSGLLEHERVASLSTLRRLPHQAGAYAALRACVGGAVGWVSLWGGFGTGKTTLLLACIADFVRAGGRAYYTNAGRLLNRLRETFDERSRTERTAEIRGWLESVPVLALDELHQINPTDWAMAEVHHLLDARYRVGLVTLLAYNLSPDEMAIHGFGAIISRAREGAAGNVVFSLDGPDIRSVADSSRSHAAEVAGGSARHGS